MSSKNNRRVEDIENKNSLNDSFNFEVKSSYHLLLKIILLRSDRIMLLPFCLKSNFTPKFSSS